MGKRKNKDKDAIEKSQVETTVEETETVESEENESLEENQTTEAEIDSAETGMEEEDSSETEVSATKEESTKNDKIDESKINTFKQQAKAVLDDPNAGVKELLEKTDLPYIKGPVTSIASFMAAFYQKPVGFNENHIQRFKNTLKRVADVKHPYLIRIFGIVLQRELVKVQKEEPKKIMHIVGNVQNQTTKDWLQLVTFILENAKGNKQDVTALSRNSFVNGNQEIIKLLETI